MSRARTSSTAGDLEDRLQRTLEENHRLKAALKERDEKLTRVQTQFRRLSADWKQSVQEGSLAVARPGTSPSASLRSGSAVLPHVPVSKAAGLPTSVSRSFAPQPDSSAERATTQATLRQTETEVKQLRGVIQQLQQRQQQPLSPSQRGSSIGQTKGRLPSLSPCTDPNHHQLQQQLQDAYHQLSTHEAEHAQTVARLQQQLQETARSTGGAQIASASVAQDDTAAAAAATAATAEVAYRSAIDALSRERDALKVRVRLLEEGLKGAAATPMPDPVSLLQLQGEVRDRTAQVTLLGSRLQSAQAQVETLKGECGRLVEELKAAHVTHAEAAKQIFQLEHEKGSLQARCGRLDEAETTVQRKNEEIVRLEQELLKMMNALRVCSTETEQAVRREMASRVADLESMRDQADEQRRTKERELLQCQSELADARHRITGLTQDMNMYRVELSKVERDKAEMATRAAFSGHMVSNLNDEEVHRAFAIAAIHKRQQQPGSPSSPNGAATDSNRRTGPQTAAASGSAAAGSSVSPAPHEATATDALDLYDALRWDDNWERGQLREALATAALDLELAETRCHQMADQVEQGRVMQQKLSEERDTLLEENLELRQRITRVQTVLVRQQLSAYRKTAAEVATIGRSTEHAASIGVSVRGLECVSPAMEHALGVSKLGEPTAVFITLDGLQEYDTMLSPTLHAVHAEEPLDIHFLYHGLDPDEATLAQVQRTTFVLQLHRTAATADGVDSTAGSAVVAMAEVPGLTLLAARETTVTERLPLIGGDGVIVGTLTVDLNCAGLMLPILLGRPLEGLALLSAAEMRATLVSLRAVRFLRVQVFRAEGLPPSTAARTQGQLTSHAGDGNGGGGGDRPSPVVQLADSDDEAGEGQREARTAAPAVAAAAVAATSTTPALSDRPQPYVFYTAQAPASSAAAGAAGTGGLRCIADTVVRPTNSAFTTDPIFDAAPVDHRVVVDRELVRFLAQGTIVFVVFDERATDVRANLGMVEVALHPLLASPQAYIRATEPLRPQGSLSFGLSWVCGP